MIGNKCPKCQATHIIKSGKVKDRQRFLCKACNYHFTVNKLGKRIDDYYVIKALQLYLQGLGYREIERVLGVSHVTVMKWVKQFFKKVPERHRSSLDCEILNVEEVCQYMQDKDNINGRGFLLTHLGSKMLLIKWDAEKVAV